MADLHIIDACPNFLVEICNGEPWFFRVALEEGKLLLNGLAPGTFLVCPGGDDFVTVIKCVADGQVESFPLKMRDDGKFMALDFEGQSPAHILEQMQLTTPYAAWQSNRAMSSPTERRARAHTQRQGMKLTRSIDQLTAFLGPEAVDPANPYSNPLIHAKSLATQDASKPGDLPSARAPSKSLSAGSRRAVAMTFALPSPQPTTPTNPEAALALDSGSSRLVRLERASRTTVHGISPSNFDRPLPFSISTPNLSAHAEPCPAESPTFLRSRPTALGQSRSVIELPTAPSPLGSPGQPHSQPTSRVSFSGRERSGVVIGLSPRETASEGPDVFGPAPTKRVRIERELAATEESYLASLNTCVNLYLVPLEGTSILSAQKLRSLFSNIREVAAVSRRLVPSFRLGAVCLAQLGLLEPYRQFILDSSVSLQLLGVLQKKKKWRDFEEERSRQASLNSLLIQPVQRILRYRLLLTDLLSQTPPTHPEHGALNQALKIVSDFAEGINKVKNAEEHTKKLAEIENRIMRKRGHSLLQSGREFIREGQLMKVCRKASKPRYIFLFNDALVVCTQWKELKEDERLGYAGKTQGREILGKIGEQKQSKRFIFKEIYELATIWITDLADQGEILNAFQILSTVKSFMVYAETAAEKNLWVKDFLSLTDNSKVRLAAPVWVPDAATERCLKCQDKFTTVRRRHHCRNCGNIYCAKCSSQKQILPHFNPNPSEVQRPLRVCDYCVKLLADLNMDVIEKEVSELFDSE